MTELARQRDDDTKVGASTILQRDRVHRAGNVRVPTIGCEDRSANQNVRDCACERRDPAYGSLPGDRNLGQFVAYTVDVDAQSREGGTSSGWEVRRAGKLDRRSRAAVQHADR